MPAKKEAAPRDRRVQAFDALWLGLELKRLRKARKVKQEAIAGALWKGASLSVAWRLEWGLRSSMLGPWAIRELAALLAVPEVHLLRAAGYGVACGCPECPALEALWRGKRKGVAHAS